MLTPVSVPSAALNCANDRLSGELVGLTVVSMENASVSLTVDAAATSGNNTAAAKPTALSVFMRIPFVRDHERVHPDERRSVWVRLSPSSGILPGGNGGGYGVSLSVP